MRNIQRVGFLEEKGVIMEAGLAAIQTAKESGAWQEAIDRENPDYIPPDLEEAINQDPEGQQAYRRLSESRRKRYVYWMQSAKQKKTRQKRIKYILKELRSED